MCFGNIHTTQGAALGTAPVELFMVGDLAFYSMVLGKESMANHWCWRCNLSKSEWTSNIATRIGNEWTVASMAEHLQKIESGTLDKNKSDQVRGVKAKALTCIPPKNIIAPSLHNVELFVNTPVNKGFMIWVHHRIEQLPIELIDARLAHVDLIIELEDVAGQLQEVSKEVSTTKVLKDFDQFSVKNADLSRAETAAKHHKALPTSSGPAKRLGASQRASAQA